MEITDVLMTVVLPLVAALFSMIGVIIGKVIIATVKGGWKEIPQILNDKERHFYEWEHRNDKRDKTSP